MNHATTRSCEPSTGSRRAQLADPSLLPGWSRGHVVAHLALNAGALAGVLAGLAHGAPPPMYDCPERRDADIESTAALPAGALRELSFAVCDRWQDAIDSGTDWEALMERTPGGPTFSAGECVDMRWREVEIHHADLGLDYTAADWSETFVDVIFNRLVHDRQNGPAMLLRTPDGDVLIGDGYGPS